MTKAQKRPPASASNGNTSDDTDETPQRSPSPPGQPKPKVFSPTKPPPPATPLHRHGSNPPEISLRVLLPFLIVLERRSSADEVNAIVKAAAKAVGLPDGAVSYYALREGSVDDVWVSMRFLDELRDGAFKRLYDMEKPPPRGHPLWQIWREAGRVTVEKKGMGSIVFPIVKAFGSPGMLYCNLPFTMSKGNTVLDTKVLNSSAGRVEISMKPHHPKTYKEGHECCLNRIGSLESFPLIWGLKPAQVEHTRCMHDPANPADECRYVVRFEERWLWGALRTVLKVALVSFVAFYHSPLSREASLAVLAYEGWSRYRAMRDLHLRDTKHTQDLIDMYDKRYVDLWKESEELRRLTLDNRNISAYVPPSLLDKLRHRRDQVPRLGGSKREATIVFVDIRNYSTLAERLDPEQTLNVLNECFSAWVKDVQKHGGTVLEFLGDGMLAVFGAPNAMPDHPAQAVRCLQTMVHTMERLNKTWEVTGGLRAALSKSASSSKLEFRGGVHTGMVIAGNLGSATQMKYAVVGDTVNVAARLEQLNKSLGTTVAVSGDTWNHLTKDLKKWFSPKGHHSVKGRDQHVEVYAHGSTPLVLPAKRRLSLQ